MPVEHAIWKIGTQPQPLKEATLNSEGFMDKCSSDRTSCFRNWIFRKSEHCCQAHNGEMGTYG